MPRPAIGAEVDEAWLQVADKSRILVHGIGLASHELLRLTNKSLEPDKTEDRRRPLEPDVVLPVETMLQTWAPWLDQAGGRPSRRLRSWS